MIRDTLYFNFFLLFWLKRTEFWIHGKHQSKNIVLLKSGLKRLFNKLNYTPVTLCISTTFAYFFHRLLKLFNYYYPDDILTKYVNYFQVGNWTRHFCLRKTIPYIHQLINKRVTSRPTLCLRLSVPPMWIYTPLNAYLSLFLFGSIKSVCLYE